MSLSCSISNREVSTCQSCIRSRLERRSTEAHAARFIRSDIGGERRLENSVELRLNNRGNMDGAKVELGLTHGFERRAVSNS